jgi:hypothetical protein
MAQPEAQVLRMLHGVNQGVKRTHSFDVDFTEQYGEKFKGRFTVHHPSQMERMRIGILQSQLTGGYAPMDDRTDNLVLMIATLDTVLDTKPAWFDVTSDDVEYEMILEVFLEYRKWMDSFRKPTKPVDNTGTSEHTEG